MHGFHVIALMTHLFDQKEDNQEINFAVGTNPYGIMSNSILNCHNMEEPYDPVEGFNVNSK
jgi:hypothetical protein